MENKDLEKKELDLLIEKGVSFKVPKRSFLKYFGEKERTFEIKPLYTGTLLRMGKEFLNMEIDIEALDNKDESLNEAQKSILNAKRLCKVIAIAVLNSKTNSSIIQNLLANYFLSHLTSKKVHQISNIIFTMENLPDFIASIRLMSIQRTMTAPKLIDTALPQA